MDTDANSIKKIKSKESLLDEYMNAINKKCEERIDMPKKVSKITDENITIPTVNNYMKMSNYNYNVNQLKQFAKHYKLKVSGNKNELMSRVYNFLYFSHFITKIQKIFRGHIVRRYKKLRGPAIFRRGGCTNNCDFVTMDHLEEIPFHQFFSYQDQDGFIYGFDVASLYNLFKKEGLQMKNPYTRNVMPERIIKNIKTLHQISKIIGIDMNLEFDDVNETITTEKKTELRIVALFQSIDALGNYSNPDWFLSLTRSQIIKMLREMIDIWNYRAQLPMEIKRNICPPNGDPFRGLHLGNLNTMDFHDLRKTVVNVLEKMINLGVDKDSKSLGAYYILGSLTLVNNNAATCMPWLYQSMIYF